MNVNIGCGSSPTPGYRNFDNSISLRVSRFVVVRRLFARIGLVSAEQVDFALKAQANGVEYGDVVRGLPIEDEVCEVFYSSHTLEHLDSFEVARFCEEALRVLRPGGILRLALPDLAHLARTYTDSGDAESFVRSLRMAVPKPRSLRDRVVWLLVGPRQHHWMYDGTSACQLLERHGFEAALVLPPGETTIPNPGGLNLYERVDESVYVEARKPLLR